MAKRKKPAGGKDEISRKLREMDAKTTQALDQKLADLRDKYTSLDPAERQAIKKWVNTLADFDEPEELVVGYFKARIEVLIQGEKNKIRRLLVSVRSLKKPIPFWYRGEQYVPTWTDT